MEKQQAIVKITDLRQARDRKLLNIESQRASIEDKISKLYEDLSSLETEVIASANYANGQIDLLVDLFGADVATGDCCTESAGCSAGCAGECK